MADEAPPPNPWAEKTSLLSAEELKAALAASEAASLDTASLAPESGATIDVSASRVPSPAPDPRDEQGKPFGRYRLLVELGRGGMGIVWKAWDKELRRIVALKQLLSEAGLVPAQVERFMREARLAARLSHPGIVGVLDVGSLDGQPFFTADYVEGRSLDQVAKGGIEPRQAAEWARQVAEALAYAHGTGVIHRDVKPGNVLIDTAGKTHVMDFGLAREVDLGGEAEALRLTRSGALVGTPQYMSPEQAGGDLSKCGPASDQFSLGAVLYEMLAGRPPFTGDGLREVLNAIADLDPVPIRRLRPRVDRDLETICLKALEKAPGGRYSTMRDFAGDLGRWLDGEPIQAHALSLGGRLLRKARKHPWAVASSVGAVFLALAGAGLFVASEVSRARELEQALRAGASARERGDAAAARDAFLQATRLDTSNEQARAGLRWAEAEIVQLARQEQAAHERVVAEKAEAEAVLEKAGRAQNVLARWVLLGEALARMERAWYDSTHDPIVRRHRAMESWPAVQAFLDETPPDPTSQAAARAFAAWARVLAGNEDGWEWFGESRALDPDLPYGDLLEAFSCLGNYLALAPLPAVNIGPGGPLPGPAPPESEPLRKTRERMEELLASAARARVWGRGMAEEFRRVAEAIQAIADGRHAEAESALTSALGTAAARTFRGDIQLARAKMRYLTGHYDEALADLDLVRDARPSCAEVYYFRGVVCQGLGMARMFSGGDWKAPYERGVSEFGKALHLAPGFPEALSGRSILRKALGDIDGAIEDLDACIARIPDNYVAYVNRGVARQAKGDLEGSLADYDKALQLEPRIPAALTNRANVKGALGDRDGAMRDYDAAIALDPRMPQAWYNRACLREDEGDDVGAEADHTEAIRLAPRFSQALQSRGNLRARRGDLDGAIADYSTVIEALPNYAQGWWARAQMKYQKGDIEGSISDTEEALRLLPEGDPERAKVEGALKRLREPK